MKTAALETVGSAEPLLSGEIPLRARRLALCALTLRVLTAGLDLLGVPVPEQM